MKCACGKSFVQYSTLQTKCPNCTFKAAITKKAIKQDKEPFQIQKFVTGAKTKPKRKKTPKQLAEINAWNWCSRYIRLKHSVNGQFCVCYTCGKRHSIKGVDAGHFISSDIDAVKYHLNNIRPQGPSCNRFKQGKHYEFEMNLIDEIGKDEVENLKELAKTEVHRTEQDYRELANFFRTKVKQLQQEFHVKIW